MRTDETHIYLLVDEQHNSHYPVVIALDIEHVTVVAYIVHGIERLLDIGKALPAGL